MLDRRSFLKSSAVVGALAFTPGLTRIASALNASWEKHFEGTALYWELDCWRSFMSRHCDVNDADVMNIAAEFRNLQKSMEHDSPAQSPALINDWTGKLRDSDLAARHPLFTRWVIAEAEGLLGWKIQVAHMHELANAADEAFFTVRYAWSLWTEATFGAGSLHQALAAFEHARAVCPTNDLPYVDACIAEIRNSAL